MSINVNNSIITFNTAPVTNTSNITSVNTAAALINVSVTNNVDTVTYQGNSLTTVGVASATLSKNVTNNTMTFTVSSVDGSFVGWTFTTTLANTTYTFPSLPPTSFGKPNPSYATYLIGGSRFGAGNDGYDNTGYNTYIKNCRSHIMGWFPGWDGFAIIPMANICFNQITNVVGTQNFLYHDPFFISTSWKTEFVVAANTNNWWLRTTYPGGSLVEPNSNTGRVFNITAGGPTDSGGRTAAAYDIAYVLDYYINGGAAGLAQGTNIPNAYADGFFCDDLQPGAGFSGGTSVTGDYERIGGTNDFTYPNGAANLGIRNAFLAVINGWKANCPYPILGGGNGGGVGYDTSQVVPAEYIGAWDLVIFENAIGGGAGSPSAPGNGGSFSNMCKQYTRITSTLNTSGPQYLTFIGNNIRANGSDMQDWTSGGGPVWSPAWQGLRYSWACCHVCGNGDFFACATDPFGSGGQGEAYDVAIRRWFDWFAWDTSGNALSQANAATTLSSNGCLGLAIDPPQNPQTTGATQNGCYRRRFQLGEIWLSPQGNGAHTVTFGRTLKLINSAQDPAMNGASITSFALADRDAIVGLY